MQHVMVVSALARLASQGGWARILAKKPLEDELDIADARLLLAAGVLTIAEDDTLEPVECHPWLFDPPALAGGMLAQLPGALRHGEGGERGWSGDDIETVAAQSASSASAATTLGEALLPLLPDSHREFTAGRARLLDVGVGTGAVARGLCRMYPGVRAVGIDVLRPVLDLAALELLRHGLTDRVELRQQSVADLYERAVYDLAWLPQVFIPRGDLVHGLHNVRHALRPQRWLVMPIACAGPDATPFQQAVLDHDSWLTGGGPLTSAEAEAMLRRAGFVEVRELLGGAQVVMAARSGT